MQHTFGEMSFTLDDGVIDLPLDFDSLLKTPLTEDGDGPKIENVFDAFILCLNTYCGVRLDYIASLTGKTEQEVVSELRGKIFEDPISHEWLTGDVYLFGQHLNQACHCQGE